MQNFCKRGDLERYNLNKPEECYQCLVANFFYSVYILKGSASLDVSRETLVKVFGQDIVDNKFESILEFIIKNPDGYRQKVQQVYIESRNEDSKICKACGGKCCLKAPCHWSPEDFETHSYKGLKKIIKEKGYISIFRFPSNWCNSSFRELEVDGPYFYILRMRTVGRNIATSSENFEEGDHCRLLTPEGCKLSYNERPMGARLLIPGKNNCNQMYGIDDCIVDWKSHQKVLKKLYRYFENRAKIASIFVKL